MAIIFFGTPEFAVPSLKALIENKEEVALVITQPDRAKGRGHTLTPPPVKVLALSYGIKVIQPHKIKDETFYKELIPINPEFIIVVAYGKILPNEILKIPEKGCINVHASLLPKYRGAAPIQWSLINGERYTGITTMLMDSGLDTGDILLQKVLEIKDEDDTKTLSVKLAELGASTLIETLAGIRTGKIRPIPQAGEVSLAPPLKKNDGRIDWNMHAEKLVNFIRGMHPWPSAFCYLNNEMIKIIKATSIENDRESKVPGRIIKASRGELIVETGKGLLSIKELQPVGKRSMTASAFLSGRKLKEGYEKFS